MNLLFCSSNTFSTSLLFFLCISSGNVITSTLANKIVPNDNQHHQGQKRTSSIVVVGSSNLDTFLPLQRLPTSGENLTLLPNTNPTMDVPGGKGCNQAIACSKLASSGHYYQTEIYFVSRLGDVSLDPMTMNIHNVLKENKVNMDYCINVDNEYTGRGYVCLEKESGKVSAVISGGSNIYGWKGWNDNKEAEASQNNKVDDVDVDEICNNLFQSNTKCLLLQREIPEVVNYKLAKNVANRNKDKNDNVNEKIIVLQDIGGEERPMTQEMLSLCDYIIPNHSELIRLVKSFMNKQEFNSTIKKMTTNEKIEHEQIIELAKVLQSKGCVNNVLVTLGDNGSILIPKKDDKIIDSDEITYYQKACTLPSCANVVDETGAGDCYRAGFAIALSEGKNIQESMKFASAAGALAVTKEGAVPSIPTRKEVEDLLKTNEDDETSQMSMPSTSETVIDSSINIPRGGGSDNNDDEDFPYMFGSRLNSMKDRPELWSQPVDNVKEWIKRQSTIQGLGCVDFNWPQHFHSWDAMEAKAALDDAGLVAGSVCLRYPSKFARGAMNHPDPELRREAIELTKEAAEIAKILGCNEVVVWSAFDGYDYPFQVDYKEKWNEIVQAFQECCDAYPDIKWALEFKPTDENTRFFTVPSTGAAIILLKDINRPNMGLVLDVGHMLMAGENPAQSIAMVGDKLFGIQLNDGYTRLAAEDGMMFGSIHPSLALEIMYQLHENKFAGHFYFDTFPQRSDPVKECEYNIRKAKEFWKAAKKLNGMGIRDIKKNHDAIGALNAIDDVLKSL